MVIKKSPIEISADQFPPVTTRRDDATRDSLLRAADRLLVEQGPGALTVRAIANEAQMSTMNVYSRYGSKEGIVDELYRRGFASLKSAMNDVPETDDPLEDLRQIGNVYREFAQTNEAYYSLMFDRPVRYFEPSKEALEIAVDSLGQLVERVQRCMDKGQLVNRDATEVASALWAAVHGVVCIERFKDLLAIPDWDSLYGTTVNALIRGLGSESSR